jgi:GT2 family glycosyltransferase
MALIAMAVYSTEENKKDDCLSKTLHSLQETVDFNKHRLILSVNGYTDVTKRVIAWAELAGIVSKTIWNPTNYGTAEAINLAWRERHKNENAVKMDDDVVIHSTDWLYLMEEAIAREPEIGQIGLKRRDCMESPDRDDYYKSSLVMLPHKTGEKWICVEKVNHVMGTCVMHSAKLLNRIGYLFQPGTYGFDDSLMSLRSTLAGFKNVFLVGVDIEHIDHGSTPFQKWKEKHAGEHMEIYNKIANEYKSGERSLLYSPYV